MREFGSIALGLIPMLAWNYPGLTCMHNNTHIIIIIIIIYLSQRRVYYRILFHLCFVRSSSHWHSFLFGCSLILLHSLLCFSFSCLLLFFVSIFVSFCRVCVWVWALFRQYSVSSYSLPFLSFFRAFAFSHSLSPSFTLASSRTRIHFLCISF